MRPEAEPARRGGALGAIALFLAVLEAVALGVLWAHPPLPQAVAERLDAARTAADRAGAEAGRALATAGAASDRVAALGDPARAVAALEARVGALEAGGGAHGAPAAAAPAPAPAAVPPPPEAPAADADALAALRTALDQAREEERASVAALATAERADVAGARDAAAQADRALSSRLDAITARLDQVRAEAGHVASLASGAERLAKLQAASLRLADGRPIGDIDRAPPALAAFADRSPPTEAELILSFPDAARATLRASEPATRGKGFFRRLWLRAEQALTIRDGSRVIVGDPAAGILAIARERLAAGDLAGAVSVLGNLDGAAAAAMDPWRSRAASVVDARAAIAQMMAHAA